MRLLCGIFRRQSAESVTPAPDTPTGPHAIRHADNISVTRPLATVWRWQGAGRLRVVLCVRAVSGRRRRPRSPAVWPPAVHRVPRDALACALPGRWWSGSAGGAPRPVGCGGPVIVPPGLFGAAVAQAAADPGTVSPPPPPAPGSPRSPRWRRPPCGGRTAHGTRPLLWVSPVHVLLNGGLAHD